MAEVDGTDERRSLFDEISLNIITKLENLESICNVDFQTENGISPVQLSHWTKVNTPYVLPDDIKSFYSMFNGVTLRWNVIIGVESVTVGEIKLNRISEIVLIKSSYTAAFILNSQVDIGEIVLVYHNDSTNISGVTSGVRTEIFFRDKHANWHYICQNFTHLLRLMVTHLGKHRHSFLFYSITADLVPIYSIPIDISAYFTLTMSM